jgi:TM2 domain-containing membrane protein YozV
MLELTNLYYQGVFMSGQGSGGNVIAAICNIFIPGLGQLVQGRILMALFFFIGASVSYALVATVILFFMWIVGAIFHLWSIIDAARYKS